MKEIFQNKFTVDVSEETLKKTTLGIGISIILSFIIVTKFFVWKEVAN